MKRSKSVNPLWKPEPTQWWGLAFALALGSLPHLLRLPLPLTLIWLTMVGWRLALGLHGKKPPAALIKFALITLIVGLIISIYGNLVGREPGTAILVMMAALKMFELKQRRDAFVVIFLTIFMSATTGLFHQSLVSMFYVLTASWLIISVWQSIVFPGTRFGWRSCMATTGKLMLQALPIMLVLFVLFPRIPGPLWQLPGDSHSGMTGLSDQMQPGEIGNLAQSDAVAFRVQFNGQIPPPSQRYWRGPIFELTDGKRWWPRESTDYEPPNLIPDGPLMKYSVTLEAHNQRWLLALDIPSADPPLGKQQPGFDWQMDKNVTDRLRYNASSWTRYRMQGLDFKTLAYTTSVPVSVSDRVIKLGRQWREESDSALDTVNRALAYFNQQPFIYTLTPPVLGNHPIDEFLFETRRGFCEHYASAFTMLMRTAGIPARVVTGYQGGEFNQFDNYLIVRQADAHAWAEVWLANQGWVRIDPTAAVAPERIERPINLGLQRSGEPVSFTLDDQNPLRQSWHQARLAWDAVNHRWNQWVIGYGPEKQHQFLKDMGFPDLSWRGLVLTLTLVMGLLILVLAIWIFRQQRTESDPAQVIYHKFCKKLSRVGFHRSVTEGPLDFLNRVEKTRPDLTDSCRQITKLYTAHRYARGQNQVQLAQLKRSVAQFSPELRKRNL